ncbi:unnamed protein product [Closterium sp. NIES-54]
MIDLALRPVLHPVPHLLPHPVDPVPSLLGPPSPTYSPALHALVSSLSPSTPFFFSLFLALHSSRFHSLILYMVAARAAVPVASTGQPTSAEAAATGGVAGGGTAAPIATGPAPTRFADPSATTAATTPAPPPLSVDFCT